MFKIKYKLDGHIIQYKTCWVVHRYKQQEDVDCNKTWAKIVKLSLFQSLFAIIAKHGLYIK